MASKKPSHRDKGEFEYKAELSPESNLAHSEERAAPIAAAAGVEEPIAEAPAPVEAAQVVGNAEQPSAEPARESVPTIEAALEPIIVPPGPEFEAAAEAPSVAYTQAEAVVTVDFSAPAKVASQWQKTAVDLWSENAVALLDLASQLAKATSVSDVIDLQSRFAQERFEGFARLSNDYVAFAQRAAKDAGAAALRFSRSA